MEMEMGMGMGMGMGGREGGREKGRGVGWDQGDFYFFVKSSNPVSLTSCAAPVSEPIFKYCMGHA